MTKPATTKPVGASWRAAIWLLGLASMAAANEPLPRVVSTNLCADQLLLTLAEPEQILSISWLSADPQESVMFGAARAHPLNHGSAEELLRFAPDVVLTGRYTAAYSGAMLRRLGYRVVELAPAQSLRDIERNIEQVADAIAQRQRGRRTVERLRAGIDALERRRPAEPVAAVVVRPGGFTVGAGSLADDIMRAAGLRNVPAEAGLDRWGSLSMETLLRSAPDLLILTRYRRDQPSLANAVLQHSVFERMVETTATTTIDASQWACGLPQSLAAAEQLAAAARSAFR